MLKLKRVSAMAPRYLVSVILGFVVITTPIPVHAAAILTLVVKTLEQTATLVGATATLASLFGTSTGGDDHPLYWQGNTGPTITISATAREFDFFIDQPLAVTEFEDDETATLRGVMQFDDSQGLANAWRFDLTFTADIENAGFGPYGLSVSGVVQHVRRLHGQEVTEASALTVNNAVTIQSLAGPSATSNGFLDSQVHLPGPHRDALTTNLLVGNCCETFFGGFKDWEYRLHGTHVPEPSTIWLLLAALAAAGMCLPMRREFTRGAGK